MEPVAAPDADERTAPAALLADWRIADSWEAMDWDRLGLAARAELRLASWEETPALTDETWALAAERADEAKLEAADAAELTWEPAEPVAELS